MPLETIAEKLLDRIGGRCGHLGLDRIPHPGIHIHFVVAEPLLEDM